MRLAWALDAALFAAGVLCLVWAYIQYRRAPPAPEPSRPPRSPRRPPPIDQLKTRVVRGQTVPSDSLRRLLNLPEEDPT